MLKLRTDGTAVLLDVKVVPGASRTRYLGPYDGRARIAVAAPPEKGRANEALIAYLAKKLGIPERRIKVVAGPATPLKTLRIDPANEEQVNLALDAAQEKGSAKRGANKK